jgi:prephenate dehydrogenase
VSGENGNTNPPGRAAIIGLGLIGSSVGMALRRNGWHVSGVDLDERRARRAAELGAIDEVGDDRDANVVIIATPVRTIAPLAQERLRGTAPPDLVVTDVGSVKAIVARAVDSPRFVGGHPMAGSEQEGPDGADPDLFVGATWVLTPTEATDPEAFSRVRALVASFGADALALPPERHDALVALVSHVPHLTAANLMALAADTAEEHSALLRLAAGGFRDMTRIAAGDPAIWPDIFADNADAILEALDGLRARLDTARRIVVERDREGLIALLEYAKSARRNLPARVARPETIVECRVPVPDRPGVLSEVTTLLGDIGVNIWDLEIAHSVEGDRGVLIVSLSAEMAETARQALSGAGYRPSLQPPP